MSQYKSFNCQQKTKTWQLNDIYSVIAWHEKQKQGLPGNTNLLRLWYENSCAARMPMSPKGKPSAAKTRASGKNRPPPSALAENQLSALFPGKRAENYRHSFVTEKGRKIYQIPPSKWEENFCKYWIYVGIVAAAADCRVVSSWGVSGGSLYSWGGNRESINRSNLKRPLCLKFLTQGSCKGERHKSFGLVQDLLRALQTCLLFKVFAESVYTRKYLG